MHGYVITVLLFYAMGMTSCEQCNHYDVNGCSTPLGMPFFYKQRFTPACNKHDICYRCGFDHSISREHCDDVFLEQMRTECRRGNAITRRICNVFATIYYKVVSNFGSGRFRNPSKWYCDQVWVTSCLPSIT